MRRSTLSLTIRFGVLTLLITTLVGAAAAAQSITPHQKDQLKAIATETKRRAHREREELRQARMQLFQAYAQYGLDERKVKTALSKIGSAQLNLLNIYLDNQISIRNVLNESQFQEFRNMMRRMHGPEMAVLPPPEDHLADMLPDKQMLDSLDLNPEQRKQASGLIGPSPQKVKVIEKLRRDSKQMIQLYSRYQLDTAAARDVIASIHGSQIELGLLNHKKQQLVRSVLTAPQFERLQRLIAERLRAPKRPHHHHK